MNSIQSSSLLRSVRFRAKGFHAGSSEPGEITATTSQEKIPGFEQGKLIDACIKVIGNGGIGAWIELFLARKGVGHIEGYDGDQVEEGNLGRQPFFLEDIGKNKAICTAQHALKHASGAAQIVAHPVWFQDAVRSEPFSKTDVAIVGPDNDPTRVFCARYFYHICPVIFVGIGSRAEHGYVFVQKPGEACFGCLFPDATRTERYPCPGTPAMIDILMTTAGLVLTALDSVLMKGRNIHWNYSDIYPSGMVPTQPTTIERRKNCPICGETMQSKKGEVRK